MRHKNIIDRLPDYDDRLTVLRFKKFHVESFEVIQLSFSCHSIVICPSGVIYSF